MSKLISTSKESDWTFELIEEYASAIEDIAVNEFDMELFPNQIEIIGSEQMLDAYASVGMPIMYDHWSYGQAFLDQQNHYNKGRMGLAYEIVINSNPCIAYLMEENTMMMQALVIAHACCGHNGFFKGNYMFKQWTDPESIIDYLAFAKKFIAQCEEDYSPDEVEEVLDAAHALQMYGVDKYKRPPELTVKEAKEREKERRDWRRSHLDEIWKTIPKSDSETTEEDKKFPEEPAENLLYFIEKNAPNLDEWKREIIRIVRKISQYFYPQRQCQLMNEGYATFWHYQIIHRMFEKGLVDEGFMFAFYESHTGVTMQPGFDSPMYSGINVYALGYAMYTDIKRIALEPTEEDIDWFDNQDWVGSGDWVDAVHTAMKNFKDESFVLQYLSPKVIRDFRLFSIFDNDQDPKLEVNAIHNKQGYKLIREKLAQQYNLGYRVPDLQVVEVDRWGDRSLSIQHNRVNRRPLEEEPTTEVLKHAHILWGYDIKLDSTDPDGSTRASYKISDEQPQPLLDIFEADES